MANTMEEEIDGLDLAKNFTGESVEETEQPQETPADKPEEKPEDKPEPPKDEGKGGTGAEPPKEEPDKTPEPPKEPFGQKGHTPRGVQERINELSRSNRELKEQNARILAELDKFKSSLPKEPEKGRDAFATDEEWVDYRAGIKAREMVEKMRAEERERAEMDEAKASFAKSEDSARNELPDYDSVMGTEVNLPVDRDTYLYTMKSPMGAMVMYTLKKVEAVRNQFLMTPQEGRLAFVKSVEARLSQIRSEAEKSKGAPAQNNPPAPPAEQPPAPEKPPLKAPQEVKRPVSRRPNPADTSSQAMDEWMENGD